MPSNCGAGEDSWESLWVQGDLNSQPESKSTLNTHWKDWCWIWSSNTLATWCEQLTQWTWVWASLGSWWLTGKPGMLLSTGSQRIGHDWATELNWCHFLNLFLLNDSHFVKYLTINLFLSLFSSRQNKIKQFPHFQSLFCLQLLFCW